MKKNAIILLSFLTLIIFSCSKKVTIENLNRPFYSDFKKNIRKVYREYNNTVTYKSVYENGKYEIDRNAKFRNKVIDSIGLINKEEWLLIELRSTGYSGPYEKTFIIFDNRCVYYSLPMSHESQNLNIRECTLEDLKKLDDDDIFYIYEALKNDRISKIEKEPDTNPLFSYRIILIKNKKINSFKLSSKDYILNKWK